jgi:hypothetical protein
MKSAWRPHPPFCGAHAQPDHPCAWATAFRWLSTLRTEQAPVPTVGALEPKVAQLREVRRHTLTDAELDYMVAEQKKVRLRRPDALW